MKPDLNKSAAHFIAAFRKGQFGRVVLDHLGYDSDTEFRHALGISDSTSSYNDNDNDKTQSELSNSTLDEEKKDGGTRVL